ncbi:MAG TPA: BatA domain-containing protein [Pirellulales bacterium]|nr:BatA domain-containing protein [Pirellulales bacterium]
MTFLAGSLLGGLVLASVPIIIHILNRRRFLIIDWPPMKYLKLTLKRNRRRIRIEQMILLAIRTLAVILLILAVARPVIPQNGWASLFPGSARTSHVIVIDDSLSMGYVTAGRSAFQVAQNAAADLLKAAGAQDSVTILLTSTPTAPLVREGSLQDASKFADLVATTSLTDTASNWAIALDGIKQALSSAAYSDKEVVLITDMRRSGWSKEVTRVANELADLRIPLRILDVGDRRTDNVALRKFELEDAIPLPDQPLHLSAEIRNLTPATIKGSQATLSVDGDSRPVLLPDLPAGATTAVPLTLTLDAPGPHALSLSLSKDALPQDDVRYLDVNVRPTVSVLVIDGAPSAQKFESETDFLALAYSVGARPWNVEKLSQFDPRRLVPGGPDVPDVLVLANVPSLSTEQVAAVERLVQRGMGVLIFSGDLVDVEQYNARIYRDGKGLLPAKLDRPVDTAATGLVIEKDPQSPLAPLAKLVPEALARIHVKQYATVQLGSKTAEGVSVLGRWNNSENPPAVLQKAFGRGRVLFFTCTAGKKWTDWPLDPTYLLSVRSAALAVARNQEGGDALSAGEAIRVVLDNNQVVLNPKLIPPGNERRGASSQAAADSKASELADVVQIEKPSPNSTLLRYAKTYRSGIYKLSWRDRGDSEANPGSANPAENKQHERTMRFAVNPPPSESDLEPINEKQLGELLGNLKPTIQRYDTSGANLATPPREIWRPLATILLGLLAVESLFAVWVGRER